MKFPVVGLGLFGKKLARELSELGHQVLAIDIDDAAVSAVQDDVNKAVIGDVTQTGLLEELLTEDFDAVIVTLATNIEASLMAVMQAKEIGVNTIIAKSGSPQHTKILKRVGVGTIFSPEEDIAEQLAMKLGKPNVHEYLEFHNGHSLLEMVVPEFFVGECLRDLNLREDHQVQVIAVQKGGTGDMNYVPSPTDPFGEDDVVWLTGPKEVLDDLAE
ncbi:MAG: TrkA family potassium uptake protein [bacterium]